MKKKQNHHNNRDKQERESEKIEVLEQKLFEEKAILMRQNKRLQKQIYEEIEENNLNKIKFEKKQQLLNEKVDRLVLENQRLKTELLEMEHHRNQDSLNEENNDDETLELLKSNKEILQENAMLKQKLQQLREVLVNLEEDKQRIQQQFDANQKKAKQQRRELKSLRAQIQKIQHLYQQLEQQSTETRKQLEKQINFTEQQQERIIKLQNANTNLKKKNKQYGQAISNVEQKFSNLQNYELAKNQEQILQLKRSKQSMEQEKLILNRKIGFLEVTLAQKESYIESIGLQLQDLKEANENYTKKIEQLESKFEISQNENRRLVIQVQNEKTKCEQKIEEMHKSMGQEGERIKRKATEDMMNFLRTNPNTKTVQAYFQQLKYSKSQSNMRKYPYVGNQEKTQAPNYQKFKYQNQIANLKTQNQSLKRQLESFNQQVMSLRKQIQCKKEQTEQNQKRIRQLELTIDRNQHTKSLDEQKLRQEIRNLRSKETEYLQLGRQHADMEEAINLKVSFYDKKIKEYIDNIDRKEQMIQNLKHQRMESENKAKFMEDKLALAIQENQSLKKFKNDTNRKDDLLKDYKDRLEKTKKQVENLKQSLQKVKKDKNRIQRNLQSKEEYIKTLKDKHSKDLQDRQNSQKEQKMLKDLKEKYENKLKKLKKQCEGFGQVVECLRVVVIEKIEESIKKCMKKQYQHEGNWEAAELLGLKSNEMEEFINPTVSLDRHICEDLDSLWERGEYQEFMRNSIEYLILKNQVQGREE